MSAPERAARQQERYNRHNVSRRSAFAKSDMAPEWARNDPDHASVWALDRFVTTVETGARRRHRLEGELAKIGEEWSLSETAAAAGRGKEGQGDRVQEEAEQLLRECQVAAKQGCRDPAPFRR